MCFSASASFGATAVLTVIGIASIKKVHAPSQLLFAVIPIVFAVQQFSEGIVWLALSKPFYAPLLSYATYSFLFFAQILWPIWVPVSILLLEKEKKRRIIQKILVGIGLLVSCYLSFCLLSFSPQAKIIGYHITYKQDSPALFRIFVGVLYLAATIAPEFFSHIKKMWVFGLAILISYIITAIMYEHYIVSVWCFFGSVISMAVFLNIVEIKKSYKQQLAT